MREKIIYGTIGLILLGLVFLLMYTTTITTNQQESPKKIGATIFPLADVAEKITGEDYEVVQVLPSGQSPHTFDPSPSSLTEIADARLVFKVGLGIDDWIDDVINAASGDTDLIEVHEDVPLHCGEDVHSHDDEDHEESESHDHEEGCDPHVWLSLSNMEIIVDTMTDALSEAYPEDARTFQRNAQKYKDELQSLKRELTGVFEDKTNLEIITFHDAFGYFADEFGLNVVATIEPFPGKEPTPQYLSEVIGSIETSGVSAIFSEPQLSNAVVEAIAKDLDIEVKTIDPLGGVDQRGTYLELMRFNAAIIASSLR